MDLCNTDAAASQAEQHTDPAENPIHLRFLLDGIKLMEFNRAKT